MCGIAGLIDVSGALGAEALSRIAADMGAHLRHRGPDGVGVWVAPDGRCALSHRRLAVVDTSARGHQPMPSAAGDSALSFNGEIYNFRDLRAGLLARGRRFRSRTDTEVLLGLLLESEAGALEDLEGMYAFGLWNGQKQRLLLARDTHGQKPLYWTQGDGWWAFASELDAFDAIPGFAPDIDSDAVAEYLLLQYIHAPRTIYRDVYKLPPGTWLALDCDGRDEPLVSRGASGGLAATSAEREPRRPDAAYTIESAADALRPVLLDTLERCLVADVPLGAFLSGGIDSSLLVALARRELGAPIRTFTVGFRGAPESEHQRAREIARQLGTEHQEEMLDPDVVELAPRIAAVLDEPIGDTSCLPTFLLSTFTREHVTVALSGDGGDEFFGGYSRYGMTLEEEQSWRRRLHFLGRTRRIWSPGRAYLDPRLLVMTPRQVRALAGSAAGEHAGSLMREWGLELDASSDPLIHRLRRLDARTYLPGAVLAKVDRMSMASSLEVRAPLLNRQVREFAESLPAAFLHRSGTSKPVLRELLSRYLPEAVTNAPKCGFGLPPGAWSETALLACFRDAALGPDAHLGGLLDTVALRRLLRQWLDAGPWWVDPVWNLLILELWLRKRAARRR